MFLFWIILPFLIAAAIRLVRRPAFGEKNPLDAGREITRFARKIMKAREA